MILSSKFFRDDAKLQACLREDRAHITRGSVGRHVGLIQEALIMLDRSKIDPEEQKRLTYGNSTAAAVLAYKKKRKIINRSYQQQEDDIVGKMTITSLDREIQALEGPFTFAKGPRALVCPKNEVSLPNRARAPTVPRELGLAVAASALGGPNRPA